MFKNIYPLFERKRVLKKEALENLRDFPRDIFGILYQDHSDGILCGCGLEVTDKTIQIRPGILYYKNIPYILSETWGVPYQATGKQEYLKVKFPDKNAGTGQDEYLTQVYLDGYAPDMDCELELARFKLQEGSRLRDDYTDFFDHNTEFDTVNRISVPYASPEKSSICPQITRVYAETLMEYPIQDPWDYPFCMECLKAQFAIPYREIHAYLDIRLGQKKEAYSNMEIYKAFRRILLGAGGKRGIDTRKEKVERKVLLL